MTKKSSKVGTLFELLQIHPYFLFVTFVYLNCYLRISFTSIDYVMTFLLKGYSIVRSDNFNRKIAKTKKMTL